MSSTVRVVIGIAVLVLAVALFVVLKDDGDGGSSERETSSASRRPVTKIVVDDAGRPVGGVAEISVGAGQEVRFEVRSAVADEVHLHGYDIGKEVEAGGSVRFDFPATIEGVFEAELESRKEEILELRVNP